MFLMRKFETKILTKERAKIHIQPQNTTNSKQRKGNLSHEVASLAKKFNNQNLCSFLKRIKQPKLMFDW